MSCLLSCKLVSLIKTSSILLFYSTLKNVQILLELYFVETNVSHISYLYKYHMSYNVAIVSSVQTNVSHISYVHKYYKSYNVAIVSSLQTNVSPTYCRHLNVGNEQINKTHHTSFPKNISR